MSYATSSSSSSVQDKREQFEAQLRSLQSDIGQLSQKLSIPIATLPARGGHSEHKGVQRREGEGDGSNFVYQQQGGAGGKAKKNVSFDPPTHQASANQRTGTGTSGSSSSMLSQKKAEVVRIGKELRNMTRERDDLHYRYEQLKRETEEMKKTLSEFGRLRSLCENLQQDNESLKMSLESSEKIRKQQKELIVMMQRSTQFTIENASQSSSVHQFPASTSQLHNISMGSFGGASSIAEHSVGSMPQSSSSVSFAPQPSSVADEHREWLNGGSARARSEASFASSHSNGEGVPVAYLASPATSGLVTHRAIPDTTPPVQRATHTRKAGTSRNKLTTSGSSPLNSATTSSAGSSGARPKTTKSKTGTSSKRPSSTPTTASIAKKNISKSGIATQKKPKTKKIVKKVSSKSPTATAIGMTDPHYRTEHHSNASVNSQSTSGVLSFDHIMSSGILGTSTSYGRMPYADAHTLTHTQHQHHDQSESGASHGEQGKPPRPPTRRPLSANAASTSRGRPSSSSSTSSLSPSRSKRSHGRETNHTNGHRSRSGSSSGNRTLRSHSLTSEPVTLSQFNIVHSPYRSSNAGSKKETYMSSRRGQK